MRVYTLIIFDADNVKVKNFESACSAILYCGNMLKNKDHIKDICKNDKKENEIYSLDVINHKDEIYRIRIIRNDVEPDNKIIY